MNATPPARKVWLGLVSALTLGALLLAMPRPAGLEEAPWRLLVLFFVAILLWATEALPVAITALLVILLQPMLGVASMHHAIEASASPVFFFVLAMFCLAAAIRQTDLDQRLADAVLARAGTNSRRVVVGLMIGTALLSAIISDVPACALFMAIAWDLLRRLDLRPGESNFGKATMIGIPMAALIGGVATPAGSSVNMLGIHFIEQTGGVRIPFLHWMIIGVPMTLILIPAACWLVLKSFPPEFAYLPEDLFKNRDQAQPLSPAGKRTLAILGTLLVLWILGTWVPIFSTLTVALAGTVVLFLPIVGVLTWQQAQKVIGWDIMMMIAGVTSLGAASVDTGLAQWLVDSALGGLAGTSVPMLLAILGLFTVAIHLALPMGPVINVVLIPPVVLLAQKAGVHPALYGLPVAFTASAAFLLPIDPVCLLTYSKGYYRMLDMARPGIWLSLLWVAVLTGLLLVFTPLLGFQ